MCYAVMLKIVIVFNRMSIRTILFSSSKQWLRFGIIIMQHGIINIYYISGSRCVGSSANSTANSTRLGDGQVSEESAFRCNIYIFYILWNCVWVWGYACIKSCMSFTFSKSTNLHSGKSLLKIGEKCSLIHIDIDINL